MFDCSRFAILSCALWWKMLSIARSLGGPPANVTPANLRWQTRFTPTILGNLSVRIRIGFCGQDILPGPKFILSFYITAILCMLAVVTAAAHVASSLFAPCLYGMGWRLARSSKAITRTATSHVFSADDYVCRRSWWAPAAKNLYGFVRSARTALAMSRAAGEKVASPETRSRQLSLSRIKRVVSNSQQSSLIL